MRLYKNVHNYLFFKKNVHKQISSKEKKTVVRLHPPRLGFEGRYGSLVSSKERKKRHEYWTGLFRKCLQSTTKLPGPSRAVLNFEPQTPYPKRKKLIHGPV